MKLKTIFAMMAATLALSACMDDDWDAPSYSNGNPYGNNDIDTTTNIISIAELKAKYPTTTNDTTRITEDLKLKVYVTGNDIEGNLYNQIAVQDDDGDALIVCIYENAIYGYLPVRQQLIISLKDLYIGGYGYQTQIGVPYTNSNGYTYVSRMTSSTWQQHFRILNQKKAIQTVAENEANPIDGAYVIPEYTATEFKSLAIDDIAGKLITLKDVSIKGAESGTKKWASSEDAGDYTSVTLYFNELSSTYEVYTSTYCDFANTVIPSGQMNLTGIWKRYNNYRELILRSIDDVEVND